MEIEQSAAEEITQQIFRMDGPGGLQSDIRAAKEGLFAVLSTAPLRYLRVQRSLQSVVYDTGFLFYDADFRHLGVLWYHNDQ